MRRKATDGICSYCFGEFSKMGIKRHLDRCNDRLKENATDDPKKIVEYFCIAVNGAYEPDYWLYIDVDANTTLAVLDTFLREIWLECCGHLSAFDINGETFSAYVDSEFNDRSMNIKLSRVLQVGQQFEYEYDFGSTTTLKLKVMSEFTGRRRREKVRLAARNLQPFIKCDYCEKPAEYACGECVHTSEGWLCEDCVETHECSEDMLRPVVNSPRVGVCGYCGDFDRWDFE